VGKALITGTTVAVTNGSFGGFGGAGAAVTTEAHMQGYASEAASFSYLQGAVAANSGSGTNTVTVRKNASDTSLTANRSGPGALSDTTNSSTFAAADLFSYGFTDTGSNPTYGYLATVVEFSSGHGCFHQTRPVALVYDVASSTRYVPITGASSGDGTATEANAQHKVRAYDSWESISCYVSANARINTSTVRNRINGANGTGTFSITAGATGWFVDDAIGDSISDGDLVNLSLTLDTGVQDLTVTSWGATFKNSAASKCDVVGASIAGSSRAASATENYYTYAGVGAGGEISAPYDFFATNPRIILSANTYSTNATYTLYKNGSSAATITLTAGVTGVFENTSDSVSYALGDTFNFGIVGGTSGTLTYTNSAVTFEVDDSVHGTGTQILTGTSQVGSADLQVSVSGSQSLQALLQTGAAASIETVTGAGAQELLEPAQQANAAVAFEAAALQVLTGVAQAAQGALTVPVVGAQTLDVPAQNGTATSTNSGTAGVGVQEIAAFAQFANATMSYTAYGAQLLTPTSQEGVADLVLTAGGVQALQMPTQNGQSVVVAEAAANVLISMLAQFGDSAVAYTGVGGQLLQQVWQDALAQQAATATGAQQLTPLVQSAVSAQMQVGVAAQYLAYCVQTGSATVPTIISGSSAQILEYVEQAASGVRIVTRLLLPHDAQNGTQFFGNVRNPYPLRFEAGPAHTIHYITGETALGGAIQCADIGGAVHLVLIDGVWVTQSHEKTWIEVP